VEYLPDGTGLPSADHEGVESVVAEVNRVVELVFEHARLRPRTSLAVVTASLRHAATHRRVHPAAAAQPSLAGRILHAGDESFRVVDLERAQGLVRDHVIFSPGYGRTPHGRALHSFGPLSAEGGREKFALAMTRARQSLHVLTCFRPEDLDRTRLAHGAVDLFELLDREISGNTDLGTPASGQRQVNRPWAPIRWLLISATGCGPAVPAYGTSTTVPSTWWPRPIRSAPWARTTPTFRGR
jgi:hypothetical protein